MEEDIVLFRRSMQWPLWPVLPVKRYRKEDSFPQCGFVYDDGKKNIVYLCGVYGLPRGEAAPKLWSEVLKNLPKEEYQDMETLLKDGWIVD